MPTEVIYALTPSGPYTSFVTALADIALVDWVTTDQIPVIEFETGTYTDGVNRLLETPIFTAPNLDATHPLIVRPATGHWGNGQAGSGLRVEADLSSAPVVRVSEYVKLYGLEILNTKSVSGQGIGPESGGTIHSFVGVGILIDAGGFGDIIQNANATFIASRFTSCGKGATYYGKYYNCLADDCSTFGYDSSSSTSLKPDWINCIGFNSVVSFEYTAPGQASAASDYNASDEYSAAGIPGTNSYLADVVAADFTNAAGGDFSLSAASNLKDIGTDLSGVLGTDWISIDGTPFDPANPPIGPYQPAAAPGGVTGDLDATEGAADTTAISGTVSWPAVSGDLSVTEPATDTLAATGSLVGPVITGSLNTTEAAGDSFAANGSADGDVYYGAVMALGPIAYWRCNDVSPAWLADATGNTPTLRKSGSPTYGHTGIAQAAIGTDAGDYFLGYPINDFGIGSSVGTIVAWVKTTNSANSGYIWSTSSTADNFHRVGLGLLADGKPYLYVNKDNATWRQVTGPTAINDGQWHQVAVQSTGTEYKMFVDGAQVTPDFAAANDGIWLDQVANRTNVGVGTVVSDTLNFPLTGEIDEVSVHDSVLTPAEITQLYAIGTAVAGDLIVTEDASDSIVAMGVLDAAPYVLAVLDSNPVLYYRCNDATGSTLIDSSGSGLDQSIVGTPSFELAGKVQSAVQTSVDNYFKVSTVGFGATHTQGAIEAWVKTTMADWGYIWATANDAQSNNRGGFAIANTGEPYLYWVNSDASIERYILTNIAINDGQWHHLVGQSTGSAYEFFLDGQPLAHLAAPIDDDGVWMSALPDRTNITVGWQKFINPLAPFDGLLDEVAVYDHPLSAAEVQVHYDSASSNPYYADTMARSPLVYYRCNDATMVDSSGNGHHLNTFGTPLTGVSGQVQAAVTTDTNDYFAEDITDFVIGSSSGTIEVWVKTTQTAYGYIFGSGQTVNNDYRVGLAVGGDGIPYLSVIDAPGSSRTIMHTNAINDGQWHHLVAQSTGSAYKLYVDGSLSTHTVTGTAGDDGVWFADVANRTNVSIGVQILPSFNGFIVGSIDEFAIYDTVLSAADIATRFALGKGIVAGDLLATETASDTLAASGSLGVVDAYAVDVLSLNPLSYWRCNEASGALADSGSLNNNLPSVGSPTYATTGAAQTAIASSAGNYFSVATADYGIGLSSGTISAWVKTTAITSGYVWSTSDTATDFWRAGLAVRSDGVPYFFINYGDGNIRQITAPSAINDGQWHQVVIQSNGSTYTMYVDGVAVSPTVTPTDDGLWLNAISNRDNVTLGSLLSSTLDTPFDGEIDEVAVYGTVLSAGDVLRQYNLVADRIQGDLDATETASDTFVASGTLTAFVVTGDLLVSESAADTLVADGVLGFAPLAGDLNATEALRDSAVIDGSVLIQGDLNVTEPATDTAAINGGSAIIGTLNATEASTDAFSASGTVVFGAISGTLNATEAASDTAVISGDLSSLPPIVGDMVATETRFDTMLAGGTTGEVQACDACLRFEIVSQDLSFQRAGCSDLHFIRGS